MVIATDSRVRFQQLEVFFDNWEIKRSEFSWPENFRQQVTPLTVVGIKGFRSPRLSIDSCSWSESMLLYPPYWSLYFQSSHKPVLPFQIVYQENIQLSQHNHLMFQHSWWVTIQWLRQIWMNFMQHSTIFWSSLQYQILKPVTQHLTFMVS